jgi:hypothetical protein
MNFLRFFVVFASLLCGLGALQGALADEFPASTVSARDSLVLKGFGTLGFARSDTDTAEFVRDLSQARGLKRNWSTQTDSVLGLQANYAFAPETEGVVQLITRYRYDRSHKPEISWAFLRHDFSPDFQVRAGRLGTEFYMLADSRLIGYSNVTVRPPPDFYGPLVFSYIDGLDGSASTAVGSGILRAKLFAGRSPESSPFVDSVTWSMKGSRLTGGHLDYFVGPWQFRLGRSEVKFSENELPLNSLVAPLFPPGMAPDIMALAPELSTVGKRSRFDSLGVVYDQGPLQLQGMIGRIRHESQSYESSRAMFVNASYRLGQFTPYLGYSSVKSSASTISSALPSPLDLIAASLPMATHMDQRTVTVGTRWDFRQNWALKLQLDQIRGAPDSVFPFRGPAPRWDGRMKVLSATVDFAF